MIWLVVLFCLLAFSFFRLGALSALVAILSTALQAVLIGFLVLAALLALWALLRGAMRR